MYIAVSVEGENLNSKVSERFETCNSLLIVDFNNLDVKIIKNNENDLGEQLAFEVIKNDCEAIITGELSSVAFNLLADACVTRYLGIGHLAKDALELMDKNLLRCIKNHEGTDECTGHEH